MNQEDLGGPGFFIIMEENLLEIEIRGYKFRMHTKSGVFSSKALDEGTRLLLENLEVSSHSVIADLGAGSGIVGFVAARLNKDGHVHLLEDHIRSFELLEKNVAQNRLDERVEVFLSDLFSAVGERTYHQILTNPPQQLGNEFLEELVSQCAIHLKDQGEIWLVVKNNVKPFMKRLLESRFADVKIVAQSREYSVLKGVKNGR